MATTFVILIHHADALYARQAAMEAFRLCDHLEAELSRFSESSSISRLNRAAAGEEIPLNADAYLCLKQALHIADLTGGAFDIGFRSRTARDIRDYRPPLVLSGLAVSACPARPEPDLDLGAIGKGYAIDKMGELLADWNLPRSLVMGGGSTLLAVGDPPGHPGWPISLSNDSATPYHLPAGWSVSASGTAVRGDHVRDPATGAAAGHALRTWACALSAAVSDALSTAFLAMPAVQVRAFASNWPECGVAIQHFSGDLEFAGHRILLEK